MRLFLVLLLSSISAQGFSEEMVLVSWQPGTFKVALTAFPWKHWRKKLRGKSDVEIWSVKYPGCIPESLVGWNHSPVSRSQSRSLLPPNRDNRSRWRWNAQIGRVAVDLTLPESPEEKHLRLRGIITNSASTRDERIDALLELY